MQASPHASYHGTIRGSFSNTGKSGLGESTCSDALMEALAPLFAVQNPYMALLCDMLCMYS